MTRSTDASTSPQPDNASPDLVEPPECRFCGDPLTQMFVDLGMTPLCQTQISPDEVDLGEVFYPLRTRVCGGCFLVQADKVVEAAQIFAKGDYAYFSSFSTSWLDHASRFCAEMTDKLGLNEGSFVVEVASNDGYLLKNFTANDIRVLGIEPAPNTAAAAIQQGIPTEVCFLGEGSAERIRQDNGPADLVVGNNVLAHVPMINDFVIGLRTLLGPDGVLSMEFPHLKRLVEENEFDTIYHEHYSYLSLGAVTRIFAHHGLAVFDVQELPTHGGSLRVLAAQQSSKRFERTQSVDRVLAEEADAGMNRLAYYEAFGERVAETKRKLLEFLIAQKRLGKSIVGYGAPGKGNTLLNYCGISTDFIDYTVDRSPHKQGHLLPGSRIPILAPEVIFETKPDLVMILPWNLKEEIRDAMVGVYDWGGEFFVPIPEVRVLARPGEQSADEGKAL